MPYGACHEYAACELHAIFQGASGVRQVPMERRKVK
jgi:hypothetical protein